MLGGSQAICFRSSFRLKMRIRKAALPRQTRRVREKARNPVGYESGLLLKTATALAAAGADARAERA